MDSEKIKILEMIEKGVISSSQGMKLLEALDNNEAISPELITGNAKWLRIRIIDPKEGTKAKINIPISIVKVALGLGVKFSKDLKGIEGIDGFDPNEIIELIQNGAEGKIVDIEQDDGTKVEVTIE